MKIERYKTINYTPALILATKGWLEQNEAGIGECNASIHWEQSGIVAFETGGHEEAGDIVPVGVITWTHQVSLAAIYVEQAYVLPIWRRRGIFAMFGDLIKQAHEVQVPYIRLGVHPKNFDAHQVYDSFGGALSSAFYKFDVR